MPLLDVAVVKMSYAEEVNRLVIGGFIASFPPSVLL